MRSNIKTISVNIEIESKNTVVFDYVTNWENQNNWVFLTKVKGVGTNSRKLGGKLEAFTGIGTFGFIDTMTITAWENSRVCEVTHTGNVVKGKGVFAVSTKGLLTYFTWTEYVELPFGTLGRFGWIFVKPLVKLGMLVSLRRLKKQIEKRSK